MSSIQVGDLCYIIYMDRHPDLLWAECIVRLPDGPKKVRLRSGMVIPMVGFGVEVPGWDSGMVGTSKLVCVPREWLRKKEGGSVQKSAETGSAQQWNLPVGV